MFDSFCKCFPSINENVFLSFSVKKELLIYINKKILRNNFELSYERKTFCPCAFPGQKALTEHI